MAKKAQHASCAQVASTLTKWAKVGAWIALQTMSLDLHLWGQEVAISQIVVVWQVSFQSMMYASRVQVEATSPMPMVPILVFCVDQVSFQTRWAEQMIVRIAQMVIIPMKVEALCARRVTTALQHLLGLCLCKGVPIPKIFACAIQD